MAKRPPDPARLEGSKLIAGMPVEAFLQTSPRTLMSYLVKPMRDQIAKTFKGGDAIGGTFSGASTGISEYPVSN
jgi:hypothetical protein